MSDENENLEVSKKLKPSSIIGYGAAIVLIVLLGIYIFRGQDTERDKTDDSAVITQEAENKNLDHDETYEEFIENLKYEVTYTMTIGTPDISFMTETAVCNEFMSVRDNIGRQKYSSYNVGYRDKELCSDGKDCVVVNCTFENLDGKINRYQMKFDVCARTDENNLREYYAANVILSKVE